MRSIVGIAAISIVAAACADSPVAPADELAAPAFAATTEMINVMAPFQLDVFVDCAAGGAGEVVRLEGRLHTVLRFTVDAQGGIHGKVQDQPQQVSGYGLVTGDLYQGTGITQEVGNMHASSLPAEFTFINNYRIIGQGPGNDFIAHTTNHLTLNANGEVTASVSIDAAECR